ncbi:MAG: ABC transporter permease subunit [Verrucomicrobiota bacterium]
MAEAEDLTSEAEVSSFPDAKDFQVIVERWKLFGIPLPGKEVVSLRPFGEGTPIPKPVTTALGSVSFSFEGWNVSLLAGAFTLAFMVLPVIIAASEESLRAIPKGFREGSLALGATKWTSIRTNVIPYAMPGILTSSILGITRVAGETAPIMFTAAFASAPGMPWDKGFWNMFMEPVMALPYHIYVVSLKIPQNEYTEKMQYGTAFIFMIIVGLIAFASIVLRVRARKKYQW